MYDDMTTDWGQYCDAWKINPHGPARRPCGMAASHDIGGVVYLCRFHYKNAYNDLWFKVMVNEEHAPFTLNGDEYDTQLGGLRKGLNRQHKQIEELEQQKRQLEDELNEIKERILVTTYKPKEVEAKDRQVYFIRCEKFVKIGVSSDPEQRLRDLQRSGNGTLAPKLIDLTTSEIVTTIPGSFYTEGQLHKKFDHLRHVGEWFHLDEELTAYIDGLLEKAA